MGRSVGLLLLGAESSGHFYRAPSAVAREQIEITTQLATMMVTDSLSCAR